MSQLCLAGFSRVFGSSRGARGLAVTQVIVSFVALSMSLVSVSAQAAPITVGDQAPDVVLMKVVPNTGDVRASILARNEGTEFVMIEFFTTSCQFCGLNLPIISRLAKDNEAKLTTLTIGLDRNEPALREYIVEHSDLIHFAVGLDLDRDAKRAYGIAAVPTTFVINKENKVVLHFVGLLSDEDQAQIKDLLK